MSSNHSKLLQRLGKLFVAVSFTENESSRAKPAIGFLINRLINAGSIDGARVVSQFECSMGNSPNASTQPCRLFSQTECFGAGKSGSANDPTVTASSPGNPSASK